MKTILILLGLVFIPAFIPVFIFSLVKAGRGADQIEDALSNMIH